MTRFLNTIGGEVTLQTLRCMGFNGRHLIVDGGAHCLLGFSLPKGRKVAAKFLRGDSVSTARLSMPPFGFRVPGISRDSAIAAEFDRSLRPPPGYTGSGQ